MAEYVAPIKDMQFVLKKVVGLDQVNTLPGWEEVTEDVVDAILEEASKFANEVLSPLNVQGDRHGAKWKDGAVTTPPGFKDAYRQYSQAGWNNIASPAKFGGQELPHLVSTPVEEMWGARTSRSSSARCSRRARSRRSATSVPRSCASVS